MNKLKINQAIAHIIGIQYVEESCGLWSALWPDGMVIGFKVGLSLEHLKNVATPDFCSDLNAMRDAEERMTEDEWDIMFEHLIGIRWRDASATHKYPWKSQKALSPSRATARQRAEAFLRTLGKWEEVQP